MPSVASEAVAFSHRGPEPRRRSDPPTTAPASPFATLLDGKAAPSDQSPQSPPRPEIDRPGSHRAEGAHRPARDANDAKNARDAKDAKDAKGAKDTHQSDRGDQTDAKAAPDDTDAPTTAPGDQTAADATDGTADKNADVAAANGGDNVTVPTDGGTSGTDTAAVDAALADATPQPAVAAAPAPTQAAPPPAVVIPIVPADPHPENPPVEIANTDPATTDGLVALAASQNTGTVDKRTEAGPPKADIADNSQKPATASGIEAVPAPAGKTDLKADPKAAHGEPDTAKGAREASEAEDPKDPKSAKSETEQKAATPHGTATTAPAEKPSDAPRLVHVAADNVGTPAAQPTHGTDTNLRLDSLPNLSLAPASTSPVTPANPAPVSAPALTTIVNAVPLAGLAVEIATRASEGQKHFEIRLDPPELGRIDVRLDLDRHGNVASRLVVDRPETLDLLRRDQTSLERALQSAGLKTEGGLQFSLRDQNFAGRDQTDDAFVGTRLVMPDDEVAPETHSRIYGRAHGLGGGIDIRV